MGNVSNIKMFFDTAALKTKEQLLDRLTTAGAPNAGYHFSGEHIWVCPYYIHEQQAEELLTTLEKTGRKLSDMPIDELGHYCHTNHPRQQTAPQKQQDFKR